MAFIDEFRTRGDISFVGMRNAAMALLPTDKVQLNRLYEDLKRGTDILDDEEHLNMYLRSFGKMHKAKLDEAFSLLPDIFSEDIEVYDWGCGQGTATVCLLDYLRNKGIAHNVVQINLVEPSVPATQRAEAVLSCFADSVAVNIVNKKFDSLAVSDFRRSGIRKLHLFSNILDVDAFDLAQFTHLFQSICTGDNYFVAVGPYYYGNRRVDEFVAAIVPDEVFATFQKGKGEWKNDWTISLRVFFKQFCDVERVDDIRKRIDAFHMSDQFFAGYILDPIGEEYAGSDIAEETEGLFNALSVFDVRSNRPLDNIEGCDSKIAVLANIVSRGLPTKAPIAVEEIFAEVFDVSSRPPEDAAILYRTKHRVDRTQIHEALHVVDPRFDVADYNHSILESSFERDFIGSYLPGSGYEYLIQILEPQRPLSSIVSVPDRRHSRNQRVDFAVEVPYGTQNAGFIFELDGAPYHSSIVQRLRDGRRDRNAFRNGYDTYRINELRGSSFLQEWEQEDPLSRYLSTIRSNSRKKISGDWRDTLQMVLSPLAIARVERMLLQAMLTRALDLDAPQWDIVVVERDVPCAAIAVELLKESFGKISDLEGSGKRLPRINLTIVSTEAFVGSELHKGHRVDASIPVKDYDLCVDVSMLLRDNIDALPLEVRARTVYSIRSAHYKKRERTVCTAENIEYPPLVTKDTAGLYVAIEEREEALSYFLRNIFRKPSFRHGQLPILSRSLSDRTTIGLLPTGGGKSLTYQLSSMLQPGVTIVVDPLVSLMEDQVRGMHEVRIDACDCVHSLMPGEEKSAKLNRLQNGCLQFMLLSPERYMMVDFRESLVSMTENNHVYFAYGVIDEVHCVSEWGHDFRTAYLHLGRNMINCMRTKSGKELTIIGLTATASFDVLSDVERELTLGGTLTIDSDAVVRSESDSRPELTYRVVRVDVNFDQLRDANNPYMLNAADDWALRDIVAGHKKGRMCELLRQVPSDLEALDAAGEAGCRIGNMDSATFYHPDDDSKYSNAGIVFCPHVHGSFGVKDKDRHQGISTYLRDQCGDILHVDTFVGGDRPTDGMRSFIDNNSNLMVATKSFGMGIDKPNIRYTVHVNYPGSIEGYVQEAGRGGRDKKNAISYVLYAPAEYVHLTTDKVNDLRVAAQSLLGVDPVWLEDCRDKFVLCAEFVPFCGFYQCGEETAQALLAICKEKGYVESVDKDINLYFHNESFRGLYKEKVVLTEMTDQILNAVPSRLQIVQGLLVEETENDDIELIPDRRRNAVKIVSKDDRRRQYGYVFLETLEPRYGYIGFDLETCRNISESLIAILRDNEYRSAQALLQPVDGPGGISEGIYGAMSRTDEGGHVFVTVSWENQIRQNYDEFERSILEEITRISEEQRWNNIDGNLGLRRIGDFDQLVGQIAKASNDGSWLRFHAFENIYGRLRRLFCQKRDKEDTEKAIYRMCCIGLVEDVTVDYLSQTYELKIRRRTDEEFRECMLDFFRKYYSLEQARRKVDEIDGQRGRNYIDKCLGYLTAFVYENLERKRYRAIEDMRNACEGSVAQNEGGQGDGWLKEFIHLYFNSKYARHDYAVDGEDYSLSKDTDDFGRDDFDVVLKYVGVIARDGSGGEIDNAKHLYGATLLCLRAHTDNAALQLLLAYCIAFLGVGANETLKTDAFNGYVEGFMSLYEREGNRVWDYIDRFNGLLEANANDGAVKDRIVKEGKNAVLLLVHERKYDSIARRYLSAAPQQKHKRSNKK